MKYPKDWIIKEENKFQTVNFINSDNITEKVVIIRQKDIPRVALDKKFIENIVIDGISAKLYHDTDTKTGLEKIDKVIFDIPSSEDDFYTAGYGKTFDQILSTFKFTE